MEKTMVNFFLVASSIYHCFSFCIHLWVWQILTLSHLRQPAPRLPGIYCLCLSPSIVNLVTLHSALRLKPHRAGQNPLWGWDYSQDATVWREVVCLRRMVAALGLMNQHQDPCSCSLSYIC